MASLRSSTSLVVAISLFLTSLISPSLSQTCKTQKFTNNKLFVNCSDLPTLTSYLHWSYNDTNSSLSIAFTAKPPSADGWVSWGINPIKTGMLGAQALLAYKQTNGSFIVRTYNISSYAPLPSKISYDVWDTSVESSNGNVTIFASIKITGNMKTLNHIWQVGPSVDKANGSPAKHEMKKENMDSKGTLALAVDSTNSTISPSGSPNSPPSSTNTTDNNNGAVSMFVNTKLVLGIVLLPLVIANLFSF